MRVANSRLFSWVYSGVDMGWAGLNFCGGQKNALVIRLLPQHISTGSSGALHLAWRKRKSPCSAGQTGHRRRLW